MEGLDESVDKDDDTLEFDTAEHLTGLAGAEKGTSSPLQTLNRLYTDGRAYQDKHDYWGAIVAYREARQALERTELLPEMQQELSARLTIRIDGLDRKLREMQMPWPGEEQLEPLEPPAAEKAQPTVLHRLAGRLGLAGAQN